MFEGSSVVEDSSCRASGPERAWNDPATFPYSWCVEPTVPRAELTMSGAYAKIVSNFQVCFNSQG